MIALDPNPNQVQLLTLGLETEKKAGRGAEGKEHCLGGTWARAKSWAEHLCQSTAWGRRAGDDPTAPTPTLTPRLHGQDERSPEKGSEGRLGLSLVLPEASLPEPVQSRARQEPCLIAVYPRPSTPLHSALPRGSPLSRSGMVSEKTLSSPPPRDVISPSESQSCPGTCLGAGGPFSILLHSAEQEADAPL